ncbi:uncharacterized protein LOC128238882 [Mya arenaria]|uniref:uncharacterized protein LOC128238882 n=1 Tax=Mya arenaria TaxID=6604 RepID=UPI0022E68B12|nr:uncharacterized protein LOC128238882 [Mya arenaria]
MGFENFVLLAFVNIFVMPSLTTAMCDTGMPVSSLKLPRGMHIDALNAQVIGKYLHEMYYAVPRLPNGEALYFPDLSYFVQFDNTSESFVYSYNTKGEFPLNGERMECIRRSDTLPQESPYNRAEFRLFSESGDGVQIIWSSCPSQYVWVLRCYAPNNAHCDVLSANIGLLVHSIPDDLPWPLVLNDLKDTQVEMGNNAFKWFYTFGETSRCIEC